MQVACLIEVVTETDFTVVRKKNFQILTSQFQSKLKKKSSTIFFIVYGYLSCLKQQLRSQDSDFNLLPLDYKLHNFPEENHELSVLTTYTNVPAFVSDRCF